MWDGFSIFTPSAVPGLPSQPNIFYSPFLHILHNRKYHQIYCIFYWFILFIECLQCEMHKTIDMILIQAIFKEFINEHFK